MQKIAQQTLEAHSTEQQLRDAQLELDLSLHDLQTEFIHRQAKLRQAYLDRVTGVTTGDEG